MPQACWHADSQGLYWIDVALGSRELLLMVDLGLVDRGNRIGLSVEPALYDQFDQAGKLTRFFTDSRLDASGTITTRQNGLITAQLIHPVSRQGIGPRVQLYTARGLPGIPNRVGVVFFHHLSRCRVLWDLDSRTWCIEHP